MELKIQKTETKVYDEWNMGWWIRNVKHLIETISEDHIVFKQPQEYDFTNNNLHLYSEINSLLVQYGKKLTIYTGAEFNEEINKNNSNVKVIMWDSIHWFIRTNQYNHTNYTSISEEPTPPNTLFTSLVGLKVGRDHRFYIMNEIFKFNLNNDLNLAVTTEITKSIKNITICDYPLENDSPFIPIELTHFEPKEIILPSEVKNRNQIEIPTEYIDSSFDIVFETVYDYFFATEKTLRPIFEKKPFMVFASPNFHKKLQEKHGFMLFDNIIDYSFDSIMNTRDRYDSQIQQLVNIRNNYTPLEVFNATKEVVQYNYSRVLEMKTLNNDKIPSKYKEFLKDKLE